MTQMGTVAPVVRLCRSSQPEIQAEAADVVKVLSRHARAASVIVDCGEHTLLNYPRLLPSMKAENQAENLHCRIQMHLSVSLSLACVHNCIC